MPTDPADSASVRCKNASAIMAVLLSFTVVTPAIADPLELAPEDLRIEVSREGGFNLYIRAREGLGSVMLTESTADPSGQASSYAYRNPVYHPVNGDERRILNGAWLNAQEQGRYFIVSSTVKEIPEFGRAFHLFVPYVVEYGYSWTRSGEEYLGDNSWINIRTFALPYADYAGAFRDNPFVMRVIQPTPQEPTPVTEEEPEPEPYLDDAAEAFAEMAEQTDALFTLVPSAEDLVREIKNIVQTIPEGGLDFALVIDTTGSMKESLAEVQRELVPMLLADAAHQEPLRVGVVLYRDYYDDYLVRPLPLQSDLQIVQRFVNAARAAGGGDIPEAVYEGIYTAVHRFEWEAPNRVVILIGDAPPHPRPRGRITRELVLELAAEKKVSVHAILLPHP